LNRFFCNIPKTIHSELPRSGCHFTSYLTKLPTKFHFEKVNEIDVLLLLENIDSKKSFGIDKVHPLLVSLAATEIYRQLAYIINLSLKQGTFPDLLKIAKVIPIFKGGHRYLCYNYRPISVLSVTSKIFEKCVHRQFIFYLSTEGVLVTNQYGFRPGVITIDCLVDLIEEITINLDANNYTVALFLDFCKAFDTIDHNILLAKLAYYGIKNIDNAWFRSYLNNRKQKVFVNGILSNQEQVVSHYVSPHANVIFFLLMII